MVVVDLLSNDNGVITFEYRPGSDDAAPGVIELDSHTGDYRLIKKSADDDMPDDSWYISHAIGCVERMLSTSTIQKHKVCVWL